MSEESEEDFLINITILEGRHYAWSNMNSYVLIRVGKEKSVTKIRHNTDSPYYNQYFVFDFNSTLQDMLDKVITLIVYQPRSLCVRKKLLGYVTMDVATVWEQPDQQFYRKWAILSSPKAGDEGVRGYLKVTISISSTKGHLLNIPFSNPLREDEIEGNLLLPEGITTERRKALFIFKVYKGIDVGSHKSQNIILESDDKREIEENEDKDHLPDSYFRISFIGLRGKTRICRNTYQPVWNQSLTFSELFPPLCQGVKLQLNYKTGCGRYSKAVKYLKIHSIANDREHGFLPTFGPTYIHFYEDGKIGDTYVGKILLSLETKLFSEIQTRTRVVVVDKIPTIIESALWSYENIILFGVVLDASTIDKRFSRKDISFELHWGAKKKGKNINNLYTTQEYKPVSNEHKFWKIDFQTNFPCFHVISVYPNVRRRLYNINLIEDIIVKMKIYLEDIDKLFFQSEENSTISGEIGSKLKEMFEYLGVACRNVKEIIKQEREAAITNLDKHKMNLSLRELEEIELLCSNAYLERVKKKSYKRGIKFVDRLKKILDHPQECFPDVFLWMNYGDKNISCIQIPARKLLFSTIEDECGVFCGEVVSLYFKTNRKSTSRSNIICKIDCFLWLGCDKFISSCLNNLPKGYEIPARADSDAPIVPEDVFPSFLHLNSSITFLCRAHIYQGRFLLAFDYTGLSDFVAKIIIGNQTKATKQVKASLNPIWDQTLTLKNVVVNGTKEQIKENPPIVTIEVIDKDKCCQTDFVGRSAVKPFIKLIEDKSEEDSSKLAWYKIRNDKMEVGEVLCYIEFLEVTPSMDEINEKTTMAIPDQIKPPLTTYRMEVLFWGVRSLKKLQRVDITKPKIIIECVNYKLASEIIRNTKKDLNFMEPLKFIDMELPIEENFIPPLSIKLYSCKVFGQQEYAGTHLTYVSKLLYHPPTKDEWLKTLEKFETKSYDSLTSRFEESITIIDTKAPKYYEIPVSSDSKKKKSRRNFFTIIKMLFRWRIKKKDKFEDIYGSDVEDEVVDDDMVDWWTKYYASLNKGTSGEIILNKNHLAIYNSELENQPQFDYFEDSIDSYKIYRGKTIGDPNADDKSAIGILKAKIKLYARDEQKEYVTPSGFPLDKGLFQAYPSNEITNFLVRVYCVRGIKLRPMDVSGQCDSYIFIRMGNLTINDSKNYISRNVNPIYGRCYEMKGVFPKDHKLTLSIFDWDRHTHNDLIGTTVIDLENRLYTQHRGHCGLQFAYTETGPYIWRNQTKPSEILENLCTRYNLGTPTYTEDSISVGFRTITPLTDEEKEINPARMNKEIMALFVLHHWQDVPIIGCHLVPEHVETRSLYNPKKPGLEQGKIQLWVDIFPLRDLPAPYKVNVKPRNPTNYELRVIIWNTEEVVLNEDDFFGDRKSDIYIKGWMDSPDNALTTDVHYRSLTGEGNFNWRFIFNFDYLVTENRMTFKTKETFYAMDETELKVPCKIKLQVWDNDIFSMDDFLGELTMDLSKMPRGSKNSKKCNLNILGPRAPRINLFRIKRTRGWWPFRASDKKSTKRSLTGKLEAEFELLATDEALSNPAGLGRSAPQPLPPPNRPKDSFSWISNPFKTCRYIIWKNMKYKLLKFFIIVLILLLFGLGIYNFPGYSVKKLLKA